MIKTVTLSREEFEEIIGADESENFTYSFRRDENWQEWQEVAGSDAQVTLYGPDNDEGQTITVSCEVWVKNLERGYLNIQGQPDGWGVCGEYTVKNRQKEFHQSLLELINKEG